MHFNETTGKVLDSSGNNNHGRAPHHIERGVDGLWDTKALSFKGAPVEVPKSKSLDDVKDKLTVETWVYLPSPSVPSLLGEGTRARTPSGPECKNNKHKHCWIKHLKHHHKCHWHWKKHKCTCKPLVCHFCPLCWENQFKRGSLLERPGSYELEIGKKRQAVFTLYTEKPKNKRATVTQKNTVQSPAQLPLDEWVHLAAVYDGTNVVLYVNGEAQPGQKQTAGSVKDVPVPLLLGCEGFQGILEEARISNCARTLCASSFGMRHEGENPFGASFGGGGNSATVTQSVYRTTFYNGWQKIEERETVTSNGQTSEEKIVRQFVDSANIDEHIAVDYYNEAGTAIDKTYFYHANYRGDTVISRQFIPGENEEKSSRKFRK